MKRFYAIVKIIWTRNGIKQCRIWHEKEKNKSGTFANYYYYYKLNNMKWYEDITKSFKLRTKEWKKEWNEQTSRFWKQTDKKVSTRFLHIYEYKRQSFVRSFFLEEYKTCHYVYEEDLNATEMMILPFG